MEFDVKTYVQYDKATKFKILMNALLRDSWLDFDAFFDKYFNLLNFDGDSWGLRWWGSPHMLDMQQYIAISKYYENISWNILDKQSQSYIAFKTPNNFNNGNWNGGQKILQYFDDKEYRQILINKYKKTYYSCALGNLFIFLNSFFDDYNKYYSKHDETKLKRISFHIEVIRRYKTDGNPLPSFWRIHHDVKFDDDAKKNLMWIALFEKKTTDGDSLILPIPMNVEWEMTLA